MKYPGCTVRGIRAYYSPAFPPEAVRHEREISNAVRLKLDFAERDKCKPVVLRLSLAGNPGIAIYAPMIYTAP
jgi:hypothetical protein